MITSLMIVLLISSPILTMGECISKTQEVRIYPTETESLFWNMKSVFFEGEDLTYTVADETHFKVIQAIENTGGKKQYAAQQNIKSAKAFVKNSQGIWLNSFVFLNQAATSVTLGIAEGNEQNMKDAPNFSKIVTVSNDRANSLECFDVEYSTTVDKYFVDCQITLQKDGNDYYKNVMYVVNKDGTTTRIEEAGNAFFQNTARSLASYVYTSAKGKSYKYIFRASPAYGLQNMSDSIIETFMVNSQGQAVNTGYVLDGTTMGLLLGDLQFQLRLVDWKVLGNGDIYILDAQRGIFILNYNPNGEWSIKQQIKTPIGSAFAFDVNTLIKKDGSQVQTMVLLGYNFFVYFENQQSIRVYDLPFSRLDYPQHIQLSQEFVIVRNQDTTYLYEVLSGSDDLLLKKQIGVNNQLLINPYAPDMILLTLTESSRYTLSQGYLEYKGGQVIEKQTTLVSAKNDNSECKSSIVFQIIQEDDFKLYFLEDTQTPLPRTITEASEPYYLDQLASGPNVQYEQITKKLQESNVNIEIRNRWNLDTSKTMALPAPNEVVFSDLLVSDNTSTFFILLQTNDKGATLWKCDHPDIYDPSAICSKQCTFIASHDLTKQTFQMWETEAYTVQTAELQNDGHSVVLSQVDPVKMQLEQIRSIKYDNDIIVSFTVLKDYLYIVLQSEVIHVYYVIDETKVPVAIATKDSFGPSGFAGSWKPQRVYGNRKVNTQLIFIVNDNNILIADFHDEFNFISTIEYQQGVEVALAIGNKTFFLIEGKSNDFEGRIREYDYERWNIIYKIKDVYLYWYKLQSPIDSDFSSDTGYLFIRALCTKCNRSFILVFSPDTLQRDCLYQAWPISSLIEDGKQVLVSAQGTAEQMFLYYNDGTEQNIVTILSKPVLLMTPIVDQEQYAIKVDIKLQLYNYNFEGFNQLLIEQQVQMINTQTKITVDKAQFNTGNSNFQVDTTKSLPTTYDLQNDWYKGQVQGITAECKQCGDQVYVTNRVDLLKKDAFGTYAVRDVYHHGETMNILQATDAILFTKPDYTLSAPIVNLDFPTLTYQCYQSYPSPDGLYILSLCSDKGIFSIYVTSCVSIKECFPIGVKHTIGNASKMQLLTNNLIAILQTDASNPANTDGTIGIYDIQIGRSQWTFTELITINKATFAADSFNPVDFHITKIRSETIQKNNRNANTITNYYKIFISDAKNGLYFHDFSYDNLGRFRSLSQDALNLYNYLNSDEANQYALETTQYWQFRLLDTPVYKDEKLVTSILIQTNNAAHYALDLTFKLQDGSESTLLTEKSIRFVVNRYGSWSALNKLSLLGQQLSIPYQQDLQILIATYTIPDQKSTTPITMNGGFYLLQVDELVFPFDFTLFFANKNSLYSSSINTSTDQYQLNSSPQLLIMNPNKVETEQKVKLTLSNDFSEPQSIEFVITTETPFPPSPDSSSSNVWWIILIVVGILLVIGAGGYFFYKKRRTHVEEEKQSLI